MEDRDLLNARAAALFVHDARGRILHNNSPDAQPAPRLWVCRSAAALCFRFSSDLPDPTAARLTTLLEVEPPTTDHTAPLRCEPALRAVLEQHAPVTRTNAGPAYRFPAPVLAPPDIVPVSPERNAHLVRDTFPWLLVEDWQPCFASVHGGAAVALCFSARLGAHVSEAGVETLPEHRGRGHAVAVTTAWAAEIQARGLLPLYSTSWDNFASQGVARRLGLAMYAADWSWW